MPVKCLIPAAGKGTRMRPLTHSLPKAMLPVGGKPSIYHIIDKVKSIGVTDFVIITGYLRELMEDEIKQSYPELNISFVEQTKQKGLGHACLLAKGEVASNDSLLIIYGDTLFEADIKSVLSSDIPLVGVYVVDDPSRFGIIEVDPDTDHITNFIEKPQQPSSKLSLPGVNFFPSSGELFVSIEHIIEKNITTKGEYQITDAFAHMVKEKSIKMKYFMIDSWYDCGTLESMLDTNQKILKKARESSEGYNKGEIINSKIIEPVYISDNVKIIDSTIGPNVSISQESLVQKSTISNSIIDHHAQIENTHLTDSLIGREVTLKNLKGKFILGDNCQAG